MAVQTTISPIDQKPAATRDILTEQQLDEAVALSVEEQKKWRKVPLDDKIKIVKQFLVEFEKLREPIIKELTLEMGRPIKYTSGEVSGTLYRATHLVEIAKEALATVPVKDVAGFTRFHKKEALGVVLVIAPWNYPFMCMINSIVPALLAGNTVLVKPSPQTPSSATRLQQAFLAAGLPPAAFQVLTLDQPTTLKLVASPSIAFVAFTGSVAGGKGVDQAAAGGKNFKGVGLELGGKDPAYVREDADLKYTVDQLVDGAFFNSGQSCCGIERIYVHSSIYDEFVAQFVELTKAYILGNPLSVTTTLGPVISLASAARIRAQVASAVAAGATPLIDESLFPEAKEGTTYLAPQVLVNVDHSMEVMSEETFGPVVGIMKVKSDAEALKLMNDSDYGLTASIWTSPDDEKSIEAFHALADELETGTVFLNRCDALDPALAWTGVKDSGRGVSLSEFGFDHVTRLKSVHMKTKIN
ncbi:aldehyde dehydrogenase [Mrakia frigida]|uniref:aldehyde dehydrogenase family protein n=1 Tax=Mrakia frigida TaxID=29902 RepID=UPI003FCBF09B